MTAPTVPWIPLKSLPTSLLLAVLTQLAPLIRMKNGASVLTAGRRQCQHSVLGINNRK